MRRLVGETRIYSTWNCSDQHSCRHHTCGQYERHCYAHSVLNLDSQQGSRPQQTSSRGSLASSSYTPAATGRSSGCSTRTPGTDPDIRSRQVLLAWLRRSRHVELFCNSYCTQGSTGSATAAVQAFQSQEVAQVRLLLGIMHS